MSIATRPRNTCLKPMSALRRSGSARASARRQRRHHGNLDRRGGVSMPFSAGDRFPRFFDQP